MTPVAPELDKRLNPRQLRLRVTLHLQLTPSSESTVENSGVAINIQLLLSHFEKQLNRTYPQLNLSSKCSLVAPSLVEATESHDQLRLKA